MTKLRSPGSLDGVREGILARIADAAARSGRRPEDVEIVAVTKTVDADRIRAAVAAGFRSLGENRVQERQSKAAELAGLGLAGAAGGLAGGADRADGEPSSVDADPIRWHLVGPLQSNKARRAIELFDVIQTVDSLDLARRLDRIAPDVRPGARLRVLLQANVDDDPAKSGFEPEALERDLAEILELPHLEVEGLMTVGRQVQIAAAARPTFAALRILSERLRERDPRLGPALSMGMTEDFDIAVEEGATIVRIGRAIFGARPGPALAAG